MSDTLDVDAFIEESLNIISSEMSNRDSKEKKRLEPEDPSDLSSSLEKKRKSSERDRGDRDYSSRDSYRDRDSYKSRDYGRDDRYDSYSGGSSDRYRDRDYRSSSDRYDRDSRDYRDSRRDSYGSSSRSSDRYDRDSRDYRDRDRDRDSSSSSYRSSDRDSRDRRYSSESSSSKDRHGETTTITSSSSSSIPSSNRDSKEKRSDVSQSPSSTTTGTSSSSSTTPIKERKLDSSGIPEPDEESDQRTVFVSKLTLNVVEKDLFDLFSKAGTVMNVSLITDKVTKRMKGVGYVEFTEKSMVDRAIALTGSLLDGQAILVHSIQPEKKVAKVTGSGESRIYVGYIHLNAVEEQIRVIFAPYGDIDFINIHTKPGISKYAFIQFKTQESARRAIAEVNGYELMGKNLKLNMVSQEKNTNGTYVQVPQINNIVHHGTAGYGGQPPMYPPPGYTMNPYIQQQQAHILMLQQQFPHLHSQHAQHAQHPPIQMIPQHPQHHQFQAQIQAHLQSLNGGAVNGGNANGGGSNSNQHTFKENNALSSLDEDDGGIPLTAQGRALLTAKLQGKVTTPPANINSTTTIQNNNNNNSNNAAVASSAVPVNIVPYTQLPKFNFSSPCVLLKNMFDPETETEENWDQEIISDTHAECSNFGKIVHIYLDKKSKGCIYIKYDNNESPLKAIQKLHGRWFSKKQIIAELITEISYNQSTASH